MDVKNLEVTISKFIYDLETEDRLVRVGLKDLAETEKIYKKYKDLFNKKLLKEISQKIEDLRRSSRQARTIIYPSSPSTKLRVNESREVQIDILERIYFTLAGSFIGLQLAQKRDSITTYFAGANVKVNGEVIEYFQISPRVAKEPIFEKRERYDDAATKVVAKVNPKSLSLLEEEIKLLRSLGFSGYLDYYSQEKKMDFAKFAKIVEKIKKDTDRIWGNLISQVSQEVFRRPFKNIGACHLIYLRSMSMYDRFYPADFVVKTFLKFAKDLDFGDLLEVIRIDDINRPKKNPRAVCYWPKPPSEIHLVIKPIGGEQDYEAMFHEGGHALHGAAIDDGLPYSLKTLAHSNALTECYAFILEDLVFDAFWLKQNVNISDFTANKIEWQANFVNLMMLRRYLGKFLYEYELFSGLNKGQTLQKGLALYKKNLEETTGFVTKRENWLSDMDSGFYSSNYLRAWIGAAQIKDYLARRFGKKWFINKKAGKFLRHLWSRGVTDELEDVVKRLGYKPWDASLLVKGYKENLANF